MAGKSLLLLTKRSSLQRKGSSGWNSCTHEFEFCLVFLFIVVKLTLFTLPCAIFKTTAISSFPLVRLNLEPKFLKPCLNVTSKLTKPVQNSFPGARFSSSGREDVDVRTLGLGRPFLLEIVNPRKTNFSKEGFAAIELEINSKTEKIKILHLAIIPK